MGDFEMPSAGVPEPEPTPTPEPVPETVVGSYTLKCISVQQKEMPVVVMEAAGPHDCMRMLTYVRLEQTPPEPETHPRLEVYIETMDMVPFEEGKSYTVSFKVT